MIIRKFDNIYVIKIIKEKIKNFDYYNHKKIKKLFEKILLKIKEKNNISGILNIDVYQNDEYGLIIEIEEILSMEDEIDMNIHFHLKTPFLYELNEFYEEKEVYYYKHKYYGIYHKYIDSEIIYKTEKILNNAIKIAR